MKLSFRLFVGLGVFLIVAAIVYGMHAREYEGLVLSLTVAAGALLIGGYGVSLLRRTRAELARTETDSPPVANDEPHVGPTIWPLVFAVAAVGLVIGAVANRWALLPGGVVLVVASVGWVLDVHHQWRAHAVAHAAAHDVNSHVTVPRQTDTTGPAGLTANTRPSEHGESASGEVAGQRLGQRGSDAAPESPAG
ncbi:MAG TPA: cytochrome c oxidase subunit 4 [Micromonosporaceae bacterium]|nr:cytochrome c oxidase subunit 4 [Micromonosporaceae bacterium]